MGNKDKYYMYECQMYIFIYSLWSFITSAMNIAKVNNMYVYLYIY